MRSETSKARHQGFAAFVSLLALGMFLYLGFLSANYDLNGVTETEAIEQGGPSLFSPNHMLYRPVVWLIYAVLQAVGYEGLSLLPAQITTAACGAMGLGLFYWWLRRLVSREVVGVIASLGFGTSWAYWVFSTDVSYIVPAATAIIGALLLLSMIVDWLEPHLPIVYLVGLGVLCALAILLWQANVLFLPIVLIGLFVRYKGDARSLLTSVFVFVAIVSVAVGCTYFFAGMFTMGRWSVPSFLDWLLHYGATLPMWGKWDLVRLPQAAHSAVASLIPIWEGLGLRALLRGEIQPDKLLSQLSLVALIVLILLPLFKQLRKRSLSSRQASLLGWILLGYVIYLSFIVWWDPFEPKWFVIPNVGFWAILAALWDSITSRRRHLVLFAGLVLAISTANLSAAIWPRHSEPNVSLQRAECVANHMEGEDLYVAVEWGWPGYVSYFFDRQVFSLIDASARHGGKEAALDLLQQNISAMHRRGGRVYMVDVDMYSSEHLSWLASQTGLQQEDFRCFERTPAFVCDSFRFQELDGVRR